MFGNPKNFEGAGCDCESLERIGKRARVTTNGTLGAACGFGYHMPLISVLFGLAVAILMGAPRDIIVWVSAITGFIGLLTHCNVEMRGGVLNYFFNTPDLHRWHHSMEPAEGNRNYGENLMFLDQLLGTYFYSSRRPPAVIGIRDAMPANFAQQVIHPFRTRLAPPREEFSVD